MAFSLPPTAQQHKHFAVFLTEGRHEVHAATLQAFRFAGEPHGSEIQIHLNVAPDYSVQVPMSEEEAKLLLQNLQNVIREA